MVCRLCGVRKARRSCPALDAGICPTCCGTKRQVEIACPSSCGWLHSARAHPPASLQRQQAADQHWLRLLLNEIDQDAYVALTACLQAAAAFRVSAVPAPVDDDLREAVVAVAATRETAARGVIYEHQPASLVAARLAGVLRDALERVDGPETPARDRETVHALRRIERVVRTVRHESPTQPVAFFEFLGRVLRPGGDSAATATKMADDALASLAEDADGPTPSRLIVP